MTTAQQARLCIGLLTAIVAAARLADKAAAARYGTGFGPKPPRPEPPILRRAEGGRFRMTSTVASPCSADHSGGFRRPFSDPSAESGIPEHFIGGSLALASLNLACRDQVPTFPQRSPPSLLTTAACGGLRPAPDCRPRRALLHLSYSSAPSYSDRAFVTHAPKPTFAPTPLRRLRQEESKRLAAR
jgi:hypothetical protein